MSGTITCALYSKTVFHYLFGRPYLWVIFLSLFVFSWGVEGQNLTIPSYVWESEVELPTVNVTFSGVNTDDITISVATDPQGNVYTLTFGNGVAKRSATGTLINASFIPASRLDSPLDMAIDENGSIYIADYFAGGETFEDNGKIWVFSPDGTLINSKTIYTSFYRPLGIDVDTENVYVAEFNDGNSGPETNQLSRIRIYNKNSGIPVLSIADVNTPFRIAVDSQKNIYVSQAGNSSPSVRIYDQDLIFQSTLPNILSPGSIVIDPFDFIHVIEYDGRIDFSQFINFEKLTFSQVQTIAKKIDDGQKANAFSIKIFDPNRSLKITLKDHIDFPVDLIFNNCDKMYVNNAKIFGGPSIIGYLPSKLEFDLEIYERTPGFDTEDPIALCITPGKEFTLVNGSVTITPSDINAGSTDNCSLTLSLSETTFTTAGTKPITLIATDSAGNTHSCTTTIEIKNQTAPAISCKAATIFLDVNGTAVLDPADIYDGDATTSNIEELEASKITFDCSDVGGSQSVVLTVRYTDGTSNDCTAEVTVLDEIDPVTVCIAPGKEFTLVNGSVTIEPEDIDDGSYDNCSFTLSVTPSTFTTTGTKTVTLKITDSSGLKDECTTTIEIVNPALPPISCKPATIFLDVNGTAVLDPANIYDGDATASNIEELEASKITFDCSDVGGSQSVVLTVRYTDGTSDDCTAEVTVLDEIDPVAVCIAPGKEFTLVNGSVTLEPEDIDDGSYDNCSFTLSVTPSTFTITGTKTVTLKITDSSGLTDECYTTIEIVNPTPSSIECKPTTIYLDSSGTAVLNPADIFDGDATAPEIDNLYAARTSFTCSDIGGFVSVLLTVQYTDGTSDSCTAQVTVLDAIAPIAVCIGPGKEFVLVSGSVTILPAEIDAGSTDNCSFTISVSPSTFTTPGPKTVTLTATDGSGKTHSCATTIEIKNQTAPPINCKPATVYLDSNGNAVLDPADIFDGNANAPEIDNIYADRSTFTCADISGSVSVILTVQYTDGSSDSCTAQVNVKDEIDPVVSSKNITMFLNQTGQVQLSAILFDDGSTDNCGPVSLSIDKTSLSCTDVGQNVVTITATDDSGNTSTGTATITLMGECQDTEEPGDDRNDYIYIYPNPTTGPITFWTPSKIKIGKVEIYDQRGRFIRVQDFPESVERYQMDLSGLQQAIYILHLFTTEGNKIIRVIIR